jgi:hypothetical protein
MGGCGGDRRGTGVARQARERGTDVGPAWPDTDMSEARRAPGTIPARRPAARGDQPAGTTRTEERG